MKKKKNMQIDNSEMPETYMEQDGISSPTDVPETEQSPVIEMDPAAENADIAEVIPPEESDIVPRNQFIRLQADFDNFKKRTRREQNEWYQRANENLVEELLPVLDHFEMGMQTARTHETDSSVVDGFQMVYEQLQSVLTKFGLSPVNAKGEIFDPHQHEAVTYLPSPDYPAETVIEQTRRGYRMGEKLIRPAQVVVSSGTPDNQPAEVE